MEDSGIFLDTAQAFFQRFNAFFRHQISFVQEKDVSVNDLGAPNFTFKNAVIAIFSINQGDDRIQSRLIS